MEREAARQQGENGALDRAPRFTPHPARADRFAAGRFDRFGFFPI